MDHFSCTCSLFLISLHIMSLRSPSFKRKKLNPNSLIMPRWVMLLSKNYPHHHLPLGEVVKIKPLKTCKNIFVHLFTCIYVLVFVCMRFLLISIDSYMTYKCFLLCAYVLAGVGGYQREVCGNPNWTQRRGAGCMFWFKWPVHCYSLCWWWD